MKQPTYWQKKEPTAKQTHRTQLQNSKKTYKTKKLKKNTSKRLLHYPAKHSGETLNPHGKTTKTNQGNKQWHFSRSTQVTTVSQHTFIALKFSVITTAQYNNGQSPSPPVPKTGSNL
jgi:hypothetical protein